MSSDRFRDSGSGRRPSSDQVEEKLIRGRSVASSDQNEGVDLEL